MGRRHIGSPRSSCLAALAVIGATGCRSGNWIDLALGTNTFCGEHANGRWECYEKTEDDKGQALDMPRDDYLAMSADHGVACGVRPEDHGVECFGEGAPTPPAGSLRAIRLYKDADGDFSEVYGLGMDRQVAWWYPGLADWPWDGGEWDSFSANSHRQFAYQAGSDVHFYGSDGVLEDVLAYDIGEDITDAMVGTDGCFTASGFTDRSGLFEYKDCEGPFQPIVVGGLAGSYALAEDGLIHHLDTEDVYGVNASCPGPKGRFKALARGGDLTCAIRDSGALVCWVWTGPRPEWLSAFSGPYQPQYEDEYGSDCS